MFEFAYYNRLIENVWFFRWEIFHIYRSQTFAVKYLKLIPHQTFMIYKHEMFVIQKIKRL